MDLQYTESVKTDVFTVEPRPSIAEAASGAPMTSGQCAAGNTWRRSHVVAIIAIGAIQGALRMAAPTDGDVLWGARSGLDTLNHGIPRHDPYSWSAAGHPWVPNSWAWNVALGVLYRILGMAGFVLAAVLIGVAFGGVIVVFARRVDAQPIPTALAAAVTGLLALSGAPRAAAISAVAAPLVLLILHSALVGPRPRFWRALAILVLVQIVWVNLHSGGLLAPILMLAFGSGLALRQPADERRRVVARLGGAVAVVAASSFATPYGWSYISHAAQTRSASNGLIEEWRHFTFATLATPTGAIGAAVVAAAVTMTYRARRWERLFVMLVMVALTINAVRFLAPTVLLATPDLAIALGLLPVRRQFMRLAVAVVVFGLFVAALKGLVGFRQVEEKWASPRLVSEIPSNCRLFNDDVAGGAVILLRPGVSVWGDGRNDMYGRAHSEQTISVLAGKPGALRWLNQKRVTCVLARKSDRVVGSLKASRRWHTVDSDATRVLLVRAG